jgi:hypothetical protein
MDRSAEPTPDVAKRGGPDTNGLQERIAEASAYVVLVGTDDELASALERFET